jgi:hypothetical protein
MSEHGAATIKSWMQDLVELARSGKTFETSAGAEPNRAYAYLEFRVSDSEHSILLFSVGEEAGKPAVHAHRFVGSAEQVRRQVDDVTHGRLAGGAPPAR